MLVIHSPMQTEGGPPKPKLRIKNKGKNLNRDLFGYILLEKQNLEIFSPGKLPEKPNNNHYDPQDGKIQNSELLQYLI